jgi:hypothetical protein
MKLLKQAKEAGYKVIENAKLAGKSVNYANEVYGNLMVVRSAILGALKCLRKHNIQDIMLEDGTVWDIKSRTRYFGDVKKDAVYTYLCLNDPGKHDELTYELWNVYIDILETMQDMGITEFTFKYKGVQKVVVEDEIKDMMVMIEARV